MAKSTINSTKKRKRGRPVTTGIGVQIGERWHKADIAAIDAWIARSGEEITRGQAIRRLLHQALASERSA
jgi:hypothetical protein